jgi:hypothetical protein
VRIFERTPQGTRPVFGGNTRFQTDPHWRDNILFYEYFHGDIGAGIGASHQTGWSGLVAVLMESHASAPMLASAAPHTVPEHAPLGFRPRDASMPRRQESGPLVPEPQN